MARSAIFIRTISAAALIAGLAACSGEKQSAESDSSSAPDAEAPYTEPAEAPAHAEAAPTADQLAENVEPETGIVEATAAIVDETADKVGNVTEAAGDEAKEALTKVAAAGEGALSGVAGEDDEDNIFTSLVGDADNGKKVFTQCMACHSVEEGKNLVGPSLYGVVGRKAASIEGFAYSPAMKNSDIIWTEDVLFAYLETPMTYVKGTRMAYVGEKDPQKRADLIAYLKSVSEE